MKIEDLHRGVERYDIPEKYYQNLLDLLPRVNAIEAAYFAQYGMPLESTNGFRTWAMHKEIYQRINDARIIQKIDEVPIPLHSAHLTGNGVDLFDPEKKLQSILADEVLLRDNDLWSEGFAWTRTWVHIQNKQYRSWVPGGTHFFRPF